MMNQSLPVHQEQTQVKYTIWVRLRSLITTVITQVTVLSIATSTCHTAAFVLINHLLEERGWLPCLVHMSNGPQSVNKTDLAAKDIIIKIADLPLGLSDGGWSLVLELLISQKLSLEVYWQGRAGRQWLTQHSNTSQSWAICRRCTMEYGVIWHLCCAYKAWQTLVCLVVSDWWLLLAAFLCVSWKEVVYLFWWAIVFSALSKLLQTFWWCLFTLTFATLMYSILWGFTQQSECCYT